MKVLRISFRFSTFFFLCFGLTLFGIGEGLLLVSYTGASPWSVLAQGISNYVDFSIGTITFFISVFVIFLWIFLKQKPGMGTVLNAIIIAAMIDICLKHVSTPESFELKIQGDNHLKNFNLFEIGLFMIIIKRLFFLVLVKPNYLNIK